MAITGIKLRCAMADCKTLKTVAPDGGLEAGEMFLVGSTVPAIAVEAADAGEEVVGVYSAPRVLVPCPAAASGDYGIAEKVYFDAADKEVNQSSSGNTLCGIILEAPDAGDEEVLIDFDGMAGL